MGAGLEGLSGISVLQAAASARIEGGLRCPALEESPGALADISPGACDSRQKAYRASVGARRHLCRGMGCTFYRAGEPVVAASVAKCGCGEPLEADRTECPDCEAERRARLPRKPKAEPLSKESEMTRIAKPATHAATEYPIPLPEDAKVTRNGTVVRRGSFIVVASCGKHWALKGTKGCRECFPSMSHGGRPRKVLGAPKAERLMARCSTDVDAELDLVEAMVRVRAQRRVGK